MSRSLCALIFTEVSRRTSAGDYTCPTASVRLDLAWHGWEGVHDHLTGFTTRITVLKNKLWSSEGRSLVVRVPVPEG